jgi:hypothetical protein
MNNPVYFFLFIFPAIINLQMFAGICSHLLLPSESVTTWYSAGREACENLIFSRICLQMSHQTCQMIA